VIHVIPVGDPDAAKLDLNALKQGTTFRPPSSTGWNHRFNLDGFVAHSGPNGGPQHAYSQAFRDGALEGVSAGYLHGKASGGSLQLSGTAIETTVVQAIETFFKVLRENGFDGPVSVMVTLLGVKGSRMFVGAEEWVPLDEQVTIDRDILILPDVFVERMDADPRVFMRATFDALWQASGFAASRGYDREGNWRPDQHR
jgi:hypothetical protein